jgi:heme/copper-type cytochrome/quinol oxidase subunit 2
MSANLRVLPPDRFDTWLQQKQTAAHP